MKTQQVHRRRVGDTTTVLPVTIKEPNSSGVETARDLTGLTVRFKMVNAATGTAKVAETATGVTVVTAASGTVNYDFSSTGVDTAGVYYGTFIVYSGSEPQSYPVDARGLKIVIDSDTQTGEEAYLAAVTA